jgi:hypothetical protein
MGNTGPKGQGARRQRSPRVDERTATGRKLDAQMRLVNERIDAPKRAARAARAEAQKLPVWKRP